MLTRSFLDPKAVTLEQNIPIVNTGDKSSCSIPHGHVEGFGPTTGRLIQSMKEAGIAPGDIDAIVCSHAHIDHIGGIVDADNKPLFPNAEVWLSQADFDFWTEESKLGSPLKAFVEHCPEKSAAGAGTESNSSRRAGQGFLPGVQAIAAPGHNHRPYHFSSSAQAENPFSFMGDLTHHQVLLLEKPMMEFAYDSDPKQSAQTRVKLLTMLADKQIPVMSYHFPWPGFGNLAKAGGWLPFIMQSR